MVADAFLKMGDYFKVYTTYCVNHQKAISTLEDLKLNNKKFAKVLQQQESLPDVRGQNLNSYLIKPVQRITKYPLLLKELVECTLESHPDFANLNRALAKIKLIVDAINEGKREAEGLQKMLFIQLEVIGDNTLELVTASRRLMKEGPAKRVDLKGRKSTIYMPCKLFLFNDMFLWAKEDRVKYSLGGYFHLQDAKLVDVGDTEEVQFGFQIGDKNVKESMSWFITTSKAEKDQWLKEIKALVKEFQLKQIMFVHQNNNT